MNTLLWSVHDMLAAFDHLAEQGRVFGFMKQRHLWRDYITPFAVAAVAFTMQLAIECGHDPKAIRDMEHELIGALEKALP